MKTHFAVASLFLLINLGLTSLSFGFPLTDDTQFDNGTITIKKVQLRPNQTIQVEVVLEIMTNAEGKGDKHIGDPNSVAGIILQNYLSSRVAPSSTPEPPTTPELDTSNSKDFFNVPPSVPTRASAVVEDDDEAESNRPKGASSTPSIHTSNYVFAEDGSSALAIQASKGSQPVIIASSSELGKGPIKTFISPFKEVQIIQIGGSSNSNSSSISDVATDDQQQSTAAPVVAPAAPAASATLIEIPSSGAAVTPVVAPVAVTTEEGGAEEDEDEDEDEDADTTASRVARAK